MVCFNLFVQDCIEMCYALLLVRKMFLLCEWNDIFSRFGLTIVINKCVIYLVFIQNREDTSARKAPSPFRPETPLTRTF